VSKLGGVQALKKNYFTVMKDMRLLGTGQFGKVLLSHNLHNPDLKVAIKVLYMDKVSDRLDQIVTEVAILQKLDHPNIVKYLETYIDKKFMYIVQEYISG
jgi:serine/threonine protein kinase